ncbi:MAG: hypothetical protein M0Q95_05700 [Porticoccaceae bacterium]|nr:hypothetical protein [Porticoccaceae bacterium]
MFAVDAIAEVPVPLPHGGHPQGEAAAISEAIRLVFRLGSLDFSCGKGHGEYTFSLELLVYSKMYSFAHGFQWNPVAHAGTKKPAFAGFFNDLEILLEVSGIQNGAQKRT